MNHLLTEKRVLMPPLHIKWGMAKHYVKSPKADDPISVCWEKYFQSTQLLRCSRPCDIAQARLGTIIQIQMGGIFTGPKIRKMIQSVGTLRNQCQSHRKVSEIHFGQLLTVFWATGNMIDILYLAWPLLQSKNGKNGNSRFLKKYSPLRKMKITAMISAHWRIIISKKIVSAR